MAQNKIINFNHEKLGELVIKLSATMDNFSIKIPEYNPDNFSNISNIEFLNNLYVKYIKYDQVTEIISELMINPSIEKAKKIQIIDVINKKLSNMASKNTSQENQELADGDNVLVDIYQKDNLEESIYHAEIEINKNENNALFGYVSTNFTKEEYRQNGLQKLGFKCFEEYLCNNNIYEIQLDAQDLDANNFDLCKAYQNLGYSKDKDGTFVKYLSTEMSM